MFRIKKKSARRRTTRHLVFETLFDRRLLCATPLPEGYDNLDVNRDGYISPIDALLVINYLNANGSGPVQTPVTNLAPIGRDMNLTVLEGSTIFISAPFFDPEGGALDIVVGSNQVDGNLIRQADGTTFSYQSGSFRQDVFSLLAVDDHGLATEVTITVNVTLLPGPHAPFARTDIVQVGMNTPSPEFNVLENDTDADGDTFVFVSHQQPQNGVLTDHGNGVFVYTPNVNFTGADAFQYTIRDSTGLEGSGFVLLLVRDNNAPVVLSPVIQVVEDTPSPTFGVAQLGTDAEADPLTVTFGNPANGFIEPVAGGYRYIPNVDFTGTDPATFTISDGFSTTTGLITFVISPARFTGPNVSRAEAVYVVVEVNGGVLNSHPVQTYQDVSRTNWAFPFVEEAASENWIQGGFAVGSNFYPDRSVTLGEIAYLVDRAFGLPGEDFVSSVLNACVLTQAQSNRLADHATEREYWEILAKVDYGNACALDNTTLDTLARNLAQQFGTTY